MSDLLDRARVETDQTYKDYMRLKCQTELLFLGRLLGYDKLLDRIHEPVAKLCVQKNPALRIEDQAKIKQFLHLDPRGIFKSTLSIIDTVQWMDCFMNIRICKLTATKPLAAAIVGEISDHFVREPGAEATDHQLLFPEYCITPKQKRVGEFTIPCRTHKWREATVMAFSIETTISGWHFDVLDPDDIVDTLNSATPQAVEKVKKNYRINKKTLMPWGYQNFKGTRYGPFELWGDMIEKAHPAKIKVLVRSAMKLKSGQRLEPGDFPKEDEVELLFPELLSYEFLRDEFEDDYPSFMTQYMNDAQGGNEVTFPREKMLQASVDEESLPLTGEPFVAWRLPYSSKPSMKRACGAAAILEAGRMYVMDVESGTFTPSALAHRIVKQCKKVGARRVTIEETPGAREMEPAIMNYSLALGWNMSVTWAEFQEDDGARDMRLKSCEPLITSLRLLFSMGMPNLTTVIRQFQNYGMVEENGMVDVIARVSEALPKSLAPQEADTEQDLAWEMLKQKDMFDRTHGLGMYAPAEPEAKPTQHMPTNSYGLPNDLGGLDG